MPQVDAVLINRLIATFDPERGALVVVPSIDGRRGNPVLWSNRFFHDLMSIQGDIGARHLIGSYAEAVVEVPVDGQAALTDVDTPEVVFRSQGRNRTRLRFESLIAPPNSRLSGEDAWVGKGDDPHLCPYNARARGRGLGAGDRDVDVCCGQYRASR